MEDGGTHGHDRNARFCVMCITSAVGFHAFTRPRAQMHFRLPTILYLVVRLVPLVQYWVRASMNRYFHTYSPSARVAASMQLIFYVLGAACNTRGGRFRVFFCLETVAFCRASLVEKTTLGLDSIESTASTCCRE